VTSLCKCHRRFPMEGPGFAHRCCSCRMVGCRSSARPSSSGAESRSKVKTALAGRHHARSGERSPRNEWEWEPRALRRGRDRVKHSRRRFRLSGRSQPPPRNSLFGGAPYRLRIRPFMAEAVEPIRLSTPYGPRRRRTASASRLINRSITIRSASSCRRVFSLSPSHAPERRKGCARMSRSCCLLLSTASPRTSTNPQSLRSAPPRFRSPRRDVGPAASCSLARLDSSFVLPSFITNRDAKGPSSAVGRHQCSRDANVHGTVADDKGGRGRRCFARRRAKKVWLIVVVVRRRRCSSSSSSSCSCCCCGRRRRRIAQGRGTTPPRPAHVRPSVRPALRDMQDLDKKAHHH
jgi:hypothetical protein